MLAKHVESSGGVWSKFLDGSCCSDSVLSSAVGEYSVFRNDGEKTQGVKIDSAGSPVA